MGYYEQLYANKSDNLNKTNFQIYTNYKKLIQEEIENFNRPIKRENVQSVIKNFQGRKAKDQTALIVIHLKNKYKSFLSDSQNWSIRELLLTP